MKRMLILLVSLLVSIPLALGTMAGLAYYTTSADHIPRPAVVALDQEVYPSGYDWRTPVFGGLIHRDFDLPSPQRIEDIGELTVPVFPLEVPEGYDARVSVSCNGEVIWSGRAAELSSYEFLNNGRYRMFIECKRPMENDRGFGTIHYQAAFSVSVQPRYEASDDWVTQGDVLAIRLFNLGSNMVPVAESDLGDVNFVPGQVGQMTAYVPIGHDREPGSYVIFLNVGHYNWEIPVRVTDAGFKVKNVDVPEGETQAINASDFAFDYSDFQESVLPLLETSDSVQYWDGAFREPVKGEILAEYGLYTYVNGSEDYSRHAGIDIAADKGTEVVAPNDGKVVYADNVGSTGNTIVIEHGGGLKSFLYHLDEIDVEVGDMVTKGQQIGTVGTTGTTTKSHLHYEVRIGATAINPTLLYNGSSKLFYFS